MGFTDDLDYDVANTFGLVSEFGKSGYGWRTAAGVETALAHVNVEEFTLLLTDDKAWKKFLIHDSQITLTLANRGDRITDPDGSEWDVIDIQTVEDQYMVSATKGQLVL